MPDVMTIRECVQRAKADSLPVTEYTLRQWIKTGLIPYRSVGKKVLIFYPNLVRYLQCSDGFYNVTNISEAAPGIRRVDM